MHDHKTMNILTRLKRYLTSKSLVFVYYSLIFPYLYYGCPLWGNNYEYSLSKVVKLQNKAVRIISDVPLMEPITPYYVTLRLLKLPDVVKLNTCLLFYDYLNNDKIPSFSLTSCSDQHTYYTRSALSDQLVIEPFRTTGLGDSVQVLVVNIFGTIFLCLSVKNLRNKYLKMH